MGEVCYPENCRVCHEDYHYVWYAENELFNRVNGSPNGFLCVQCFLDLAREAGEDMIHIAVSSEHIDLDKGSRVIAAVQRNEELMRQLGAAYYDEGSEEAPK